MTNSLKPFVVVISRKYCTNKNQNISTQITYIELCNAYTVK